MDNRLVSISLKTESFTPDDGALWDLQNLTPTLQIPTWAKTEDVPAVGVWPRQDREKAQVQDVFDRGGLQVLEHLGPGPAARMVVQEQLQRTVVVKLPGPQEAQEEGVVQAGVQVGLLLMDIRRKSKLKNGVCAPQMLAENFVRCIDKKPGYSKK